MILLAHMIFGAAIGSLVKNIPLAIILAFLGHYFLDLFPHIEYPIPNIKDKNWSKVIYDIPSVFLDFCLGLLLIFLFSKNQHIIYVCSFIAIVPDGFTIINSLFKNKVLAWHQKIHGEKIHYFKYQKISIFWRVLTQILAIIISIILLKN